LLPFSFPFNDLGSTLCDHDFVDQIVLGFEEFIRRVESDRFKRMITGPEQFEKYLPLAMATQTGAMMASSPRSFCGSGF